MASQRQAKARSLCGAAGISEAVYRPWAEQNIRTAGATVRRLKGNFPEFQAKKLNDITPWLVEKWRMRRLKSGTKPTTVNRDLDDLKAALAKATTWGLIEAHPLTGVKRLRTDDNPRVRYLTEDEERCLLAAIHEREARIRRRRSNANQWRTSAAIRCFRTWRVPHSPIISSHSSSYRSTPACAGASFLLSLGRTWICPRRASQLLVQGPRAAGHVTCPSTRLRQTLWRVGILRLRKLAASCFPARTASSWTTYVLLGLAY